MINYRKCLKKMSCQKRYGKEEKAKKGQRPFGEGESPHLLPICSSFLQQLRSKCLTPLGTHVLYGGNVAQVLYIETQVFPCTTWCLNYIIGGHLVNICLMAYRWPPSLSHFSIAFCLYIYLFEKQQFFFFLYI